MGKLQIEDRRQQEEVVEDPKKEESPLALPPPQQVQGESSQDLPKDWKFVINHPQDQIIGNPSSGALYGLKQAPRACEFEMSMMGELNFFLGLQIKQLKEGTFINQAKYIRDLLKRFNMEEAKTMKTPMSSSIKLDMDEKGKSVNSTMYRGMIGHSLVSWHSKKQNSVALSTAEAEYIAAVYVGWEFKNPPTLHFSPVLLHTLKTLHSLLLEGFSFWGDFSLPACLRFVGWLLGDRWAPPRLRASALLSHLSLSKWRLAERRGMKRPSSAFYSRATYGLGGPILSTVRGVEIRLSPESIYRILDIPSVGLRVYEAKAWPTVLGFEPREAV
ncbi:hypothetical protein CK203_099636 [Vitis vinifera]|uniref:Reverse transcriptase Ty1/copia-type domain-containing protein n=1 Tax=Vitis vinifera TaxID=29760 RepID=A0A438DNG6_VITVI|nr:hypothetical protein CK203_099636 [Vitis vinifera]